MVLGPPDDRRPRAHLVGAAWCRARSSKPGQYTGVLPARRQCRMGEERRHRCAICDDCARRSASWKNDQRLGRQEDYDMTTLDIHEILKQCCRTAIRSCWWTACSSCEPGKTHHARSRTSPINEPFFNGHFPHQPVMPGVLMLEALAQAAALLSFADHGRASPTTTRSYYFVGIDGARFKRPVEPGDQLDAGRRDPAHEGAASGSSRRAPRVDGELAVRGRADVHDARASS